jgi:hypothetical protein
MLSKIKACPLAANDTDAKSATCSSASWLRRASASRCHCPTCRRNRSSSSAWRSCNAEAVDLNQLVSWRNQLCRLRHHMVATPAIRAGQHSRWNPAAGMLHIVLHTFSMAAAAQAAAHLQLLHGFGCGGSRLARAALLVAQCCRSLCSGLLGNCQVSAQGDCSVGCGNCFRLSPLHFGLHTLVMMLVPG